MKKSIKTTLIIVVLIIFLLYFFINAFITYSYGKVDGKQKSNVAIILGAATDSNGVSPVYRERINHGIWLYENNYVDYIIVTGGKADRAEFSDAYYAKRYALSKNIPEDVIFITWNLSNQAYKRSALYFTSPYFIGIFFCMTKEMCLQKF